MSRFTTPRLIMWAIALICFYVVISNVVPEPPLINLLNGIFFGVSVAVAIVYAPLIWYSLRNSEFDRVSQLSIGIGLIWLSIGLQRAWSSYNRYYGNIESVANSSFTGFVVYMAIIGGALFVTAPGYDTIAPVKFGGRNRTLLFCLATIGGIFTGSAYILLQRTF